MLVGPREPQAFTMGPVAGTAWRPSPAIAGEAAIAGSRNAASLILREFI